MAILADSVRHFAWSVSVAEPPFLDATRQAFMPFRALEWVLGLLKKHAGDVAKAGQAWRLIVSCLETLPPTTSLATLTMLITNAMTSTLSKSASAGLYESIATTLQLLSSKFYESVRPTVDTLTAIMVEILKIYEEIDLNASSRLLIVALDMYQTFCQAQPNQRKVFTIVLSDLLGPLVRVRFRYTKIASGAVIVTTIEQLLKRVFFHTEHLQDYHSVLGGGGDGLEEVPVEEADTASEMSAVTSTGGERKRRKTNVKDTSNGPKQTATKNIAKQQTESYQRQLFESLSTMIHVVPSPSFLAVLDVLSFLLDSFVECHRHFSLLNAESLRGNSNSNNNLTGAAAAGKRKDINTSTTGGGLEWSFFRKLFDMVLIRFNNIVWGPSRQLSFGSAGMADALLSSIVSKDSLPIYATLSSLLTVVNRRDLYRAQDDLQGVKIAYLNRFIELLMRSWPLVAEIEEVALHCLQSLLALNHHIVEPNLNRLWRCLTLSAGHAAARDALLVDLLDVYERLRQLGTLVTSWLEAMQDVTASYDPQLTGPALLARLWRRPLVLQRFIRAIHSLSMTQTLFLWEQWQRLCLPGAKPMPTWRSTDRSEHSVSVLRETLSSLAVYLQHIVIKESTAPQLTASIDSCWDQLVTVPLLEFLPLPYVKQFAFTDFQVLLGVLEIGHTLVLMQLGCLAWCEPTTWGTRIVSLWDRTQQIQRFHIFLKQAIPVLTKSFPYEALKPLEEILSRWATLRLRILHACKTTDALESIELTYESFDEQVGECIATVLEEINEPCSCSYDDRWRLIVQNLPLLVTYATAEDVGNIANRMLMPCDCWDILDSPQPLAIQLDPMDRQPPGIMNLALLQRADLYELQMMREHIPKESLNCLIPFRLDDNEFPFDPCNPQKADELQLEIISIEPTLHVLDLGRFIEAVQVLRMLASLPQEYLEFKYLTACANGCLGIEIYARSPHQGLEPSNELNQESSHRLWLTVRGCLVSFTQTALLHNQPILSAKALSWLLNCEPPVDAYPSTAQILSNVLSDSKSGSQMWDVAMKTLTSERDLSSLVGLCSPYSEDRATLKQGTLYRLEMLFAMLEFAATCPKPSANALKTIGKISTIFASLLEESKRNSGEQNLSNVACSYTLRLATTLLNIYFNIDSPHEQSAIALLSHLQWFISISVAHLTALCRTDAVDSAMIHLPSFQFIQALGQFHSRIRPSLPLPLYDTVMAVLFMLLRFDGDHLSAVNHVCSLWIRNGSQVHSSHLIQGLKQELQSLSMERLLPAVRVWQVLVETSKSGRRSLLLNKHWLALYSNAYRSVQRFLHNTDWTADPILCQIVISSLRVVSDLLGREETVSMNGRELDLILQSLISIQTSICAFPLDHPYGEQLFSAIYTAMLQICKYRYTLVTKAVATVTALFRYLLLSLLRTAQKYSAETEDSSNVLSISLLRCCDDLTRLYGELAKNKKVIRKYVTYLLADFVLLSHSLRPSPQVRKALAPCAYVLMDACTAHETQHLHLSLDVAGRMVLKNLHNSYVKEYKFSGRV
eukprot:GILJ01008212.1.p1 GENE.GILJ01008212.1~~GILJ01008212.1.p1  ORF type:complete len:1530 (+),score=216.24 GILJ01008212.1:30-4619(+)